MFHDIIEPFIIVENRPLFNLCQKNHQIIDDHQKSHQIKNAGRGSVVVQPRLKTANPTANNRNVERGLRKNQSPQEAVASLTTGEDGVVAVAAEAVRNHEATQRLERVNRALQT